MNGVVSGLVLKVPSSAASTLPRISQRSTAGRQELQARQRQERR